MAEKTGIEWTDHTFNIAWGCMKVSEGCKNCYAQTFAERHGFKIWGPAATTERRTFGAKHWAGPLKWNAAAERDGVRRRVFCSSMCDVFEDHRTIDIERSKLWPLILATPMLDWQLLTKRPERLREPGILPSDWGTDGYANVWLGTSIESQDFIDRAYHLCQVPARMRFLSCEPLLGPLDLTTPDPMLGHKAPIEELDWIIVGAESGAGRRSFEIEWLRSIAAQCDAQSIPLFAKQDGAFKPGQQGRIPAELWRHESPSRGL